MSFPVPARSGSLRTCPTPSMRSPTARRSRHCGSTRHAARSPGPSRRWLPLTTSSPRWSLVSTTLTSQRRLERAWRRWRSISCARPHHDPRPTVAHRRPRPPRRRGAARPTGRFPPPRRVGRARRRQRPDPHGGVRCRDRADFPRVAYPFTHPGRAPAARRRRTGGGRRSQRRVRHLERLRCGIQAHNGHDRVRFLRVEERFCSRVRATPRRRRRSADRGRPRGPQTRAPEDRRVPRP